MPQEVTWDMNADNKISKTSTATGNGKKEKKKKNKKKEKKNEEDGSSSSTAAPELTFSLSIPSLNIPIINLLKDLITWIQQKQNTVIAEVSDIWSIYQKRVREKTQDDIDEAALRGETLKISDEQKDKILKDTACDLLKEVVLSYLKNINMGWCFFSGGLKSILVCWSAELEPEEKKNIAYALCVGIPCCALWFWWSR